QRGYCIRSGSGSDASPHPRVAAACRAREPGSGSRVGFSGSGSELRSSCLGVIPLSRDSEATAATDGSGSAAASALRQRQADPTSLQASRHRQRTPPTGSGFRLGSSFTERGAPLITVPRLFPKRRAVRGRTVMTQGRSESRRWPSRIGKELRRTSCLIRSRDRSQRLLGC
ncbi:MAG: hypothetical protein QOI59_4982, partial [Gammaproteobacteria bacterium]|nr:hypothetical protein [Gammaproteobacteria bacterium]